MTSQTIPRGQDHDDVSSESRMTLFEYAVHITIDLAIPLVESKTNHCQDQNHLTSKHS
jgi:hypothetical protein